VLGIDIDELDITNKKAVNDFIISKKPNIIIHCAAYTAVDNAEENIDIAYNVNVNGTKNLIESIKNQNTKFIYISTDYVFDGNKKGSYRVDDIPNPKSVYGKSKYLGELEVQKHNNYFIFRISWVFGKNGSNFVKTMLKLGKDKDYINVVSDQVGSPTYTKDLAELIVDVSETNKYGVYHATNDGECSWFEFAKEIFNLSNLDILVKSIKSDQYPTKAKRPINSVMDKSKLDENGFNHLPHWKNAIKRYLKEIEEI